MYIYIYYKIIYIPLLMKLSLIGHFEPKELALKVKVSLVCESNAGFSIKELINTHKWFLTWNGFIVIFLFFLLIESTNFEVIWSAT